MIFTRIIDPDIFSCHVPMHMIALNIFSDNNSKYETECIYETAELLKNIRVQ